MRNSTVIVWAVLLAACVGPAAATPSLTDTPTAAIAPAVTVATLSPTRTPEPGFTLLPPTPIAPTETPEPCVNDAQFIRDVTIPDFSELRPRAPIDKQWAVRNAGTCNWNGNYRLAFLDGNSMSAAAEHALYPARAGADAVVQITMTAPDVPGEYSGRWQMRDPQGQSFGPVLFIKIRVIPVETAQP